MDIEITNNEIRNIADDLPLTYVIAGQDFIAGTPALGWCEKSDATESGYILSFDLINPALEEYINAEDADVGIVNGELRQVIVLVEGEDEDKILDMVGTAKTYSFTTCVKNFSKICDSCRGCGHKGQEKKIMEEKIFTDGKGRKYPVKDDELDIKAKAYASSHNVSYEQALLVVGRETEGEKENGI